MFISADDSLDESSYDPSDKYSVFRRKPSSNSTTLQEFIGTAVFPPASPTSGFADFANALPANSSSEEAKVAVNDTNDFADFMSVGNFSVSQKQEVEFADFSAAPLENPSGCADTNIGDFTIFVRL